ncbi:MAG: MerR family DNA-binding transcriptional regulator [Armatimonadetes bacterium]|nr:MerR family DNA-binding transcriptional regulator [Armatimonadota bacterium]
MSETLIGSTLEFVANSARKCLPPIDSKPRFILHTKPVKIGELARKAGISVSTVRFHEAQALMPKPNTRGPGYREYEEKDLEGVHPLKNASGGSSLLAANTV